MEMDLAGKSGSNESLKCDSEEAALKKDPGVTAVQSAGYSEHDAVAVAQGLKDEEVSDGSNVASSRVLSLREESARLDDLLSQESARLDDLLSQISADLDMLERESARLNDLLSQESARLDDLLSQESARLDDLLSQESARLNDLLSRESARLNDLLSQESARLDDLLSQISADLDMLERESARLNDFLSQNVARLVLLTRQKQQHPIRTQRNRTERRKQKRQSIPVVDKKVDSNHSQIKDIQSDDTLSLSSCTEPHVSTRKPVTKSVEEVTLVKENFSNTKGKAEHEQVSLNKSDNQTRPSHIGNIPVQHLREEVWRLHTFCKYPQNTNKSAVLLAKNGFAYIGSGRDGDDSVICIFCRVCYKGWQPRDEIASVHAKLRSDCPLINGKDCGNVPLPHSSEGADLFTKLRPQPITRSAERMEMDSVTEGPSQEAGSTATAYQAINTNAISSTIPSNTSTLNTSGMSSSNLNQTAGVVTGASQELGDPTTTAQNQPAQSTLENQGQGLPQSQSSNQRVPLEVGNNRELAQSSIHNNTPNPNTQISRGSVHEAGNNSDPAQVHANSQAPSQDTLNNRTTCQEASNTRVPTQSASRAFNMVAESQGQQSRRPATSHTPAEASTTSNSSSNVRSEEANGESLRNSDLTSLPSKPKFADLDKRQRSFENWPANHPLTKEALSAAGFYYAGNGHDCRVRCFSCGGGRSSWKRGEDVWKWHARMWPNCAYIKQTKGAAFIEDVQRQNGNISYQAEPDALAQQQQVLERGPGESIGSSNDGIGIIEERPRHNEFITEDARKRTFERWTGDPRLKTEAPSAGFYFTGNRDDVQCFFCGIEKRNWKPEENAWVVHACLSPKCDFILVKKGAAFIEAVQSQDTISYEHMLEDVVITSDKKYGEYENKEARQRSFEQSRIQWRVQKQYLAEAGFFYEGYSDYVKCFYCGGRLHNWEQDDDVWVEHARWFPKCAFIRQTKSAAFIEAVQRLNERQRRISSRDVIECLGQSDEASLGIRKRRPSNERMRQPLIADKCKSCNKNEIEVTIQPCGHLTCLECALTARTQNSCPLCTYTVKCIVKVTNT